MDNIKNDKYYAYKIVENINAINKYVAGKSYDEFIDDGELIDAVMFRFVQLIENIKNISTNFKEEHGYIPWKKIIGFRNGVIHEYGETDYTIVYETATGDLNILKEIFENLLV